MFKPCLLLTTALSVVSAGASANRLLVNDEDSCENHLHSFNVFHEGESSKSLANYLLFSFDAFDHNAVVVGEGSIAPLETNEWCLGSGEYVLFAEDSVNDFSLNFCHGNSVNPNTFVMFSLNELGFCELKVQGETNPTTQRELSDIFANSISSMAMSYSGADYSGDFSAMMSYDISMDASFPVSMDYYSASYMDQSFPVSMDYYSASYMDPSFPVSMDYYSASYMDPSFPVSMDYLSTSYSMDLSFSMPSDVTAPPTTMPSAMPSTNPTAKPTRKPTSTPTTKPSGAPSVTTFPTVAPTTFLSTITVSTFTADCMSDCFYKTGNSVTDYSTSWTGSDYCKFYNYVGCTLEGVEDYSCVPACLTDCPTSFCSVMSYTAVGCDESGGYNEKEAVEDQCLDSYAASAVTETVIEFNVGVVLLGLPAENVTTSLVDSSKDAISASMSGVTNTDITFDGTEIYNARRLSSGLNLLFSINVIAEKLGFTTNTADDAYNSLNDQMTESLGNGNFLSFLRTSLSSSGNEDLIAGSTLDPSASSVGPATIVFVVTASPTAAPKKEDKGHKNDDDEVPAGVIIGAVIGSVVGFALIVFVVYYFYYMETQEEKELAFKQATKLRATQNQRQDEDYL